MSRDKNSCLKNGEWRTFHNEKPHNIYRSFIILRVIESRRLAEHAAINLPKEGLSEDVDVDGKTLLKQLLKK